MMGLYEEMCSNVDEDRDERIVNNKGKARNSPYPPRNSFPRPTSIKSGQWTNGRKSSQDDVEDDADVVVFFIDRSAENDEQDFFDDREDDDADVVVFFIDRSAEND